MIKEENKLPKYVKYYNFILNFNLFPSRKFFFAPTSCNSYESMFIRNNYASAYPNSFNYANLQGSRISYSWVVILISVSNENVQNRDEYVWWLDMQYMLHAPNL